MKIKIRLHYMLGVPSHLSVNGEVLKGYPIGLTTEIKRDPEVLRSPMALMLLAQRKEGEAERGGCRFSQVAWRRFRQRLIEAIRKQTLREVIENTH